MSSDQLAAFGAFLSGVGSVVSAAWFVRRARREAERLCDKRIAELKQAIDQGARIVGEQKPPDHGYGAGVGGG